MASLASALPPEGSALWRRTRSSSESKVKHVVIREATVCSEPTVHAVYKIGVLTKDNHWMVFRRYSQFHSLHQKLVKHYGIPRDLLPPKRLSGNLSQQLIDQRKQLLERYLQKLINSNLDVSQSTELMEFLSVPDHDIIDVTTELTRLLYFHGEEFLQKGKPFKLSPRQLFSITERRKLPLDPTGSCDISLDPAHLFDFVTHLNSLLVVTEGNSVCCMPFDVGMFRSLEELQVTGISVAKIEGLSNIQQQLRSLTVSQSLSSLKELLIDSVVNKRPLSQQQQTGVTPAESWRVLATAKLADNRIVVQPWKCLRIFDVSNNEIKCLDQSLKLLPCLEELNASHNHLISLDLSILCLPMLTKLNLSHNAIAEVTHHHKVIETVAEVDLSYNKLTTTDGLCGFIGVTFLNVKHNLIHKSGDLDQLMKLGHLSQLHLIGNPVCSHPSHRTILLAKFSLANRNVLLDATAVTEKERLKVTSFIERYGKDISKWPMAVQQPQHHVTSIAIPTSQHDSCSSIAPENSHHSYQSLEVTLSCSRGSSFIQWDGTATRIAPDGRETPQSDTPPVQLAPPSPKITTPPPSTPISIHGDKPSQTSSPNKAMFGGISPNTVAQALQSLYLQQRTGSSSTASLSTPFNSANRTPTGDLKNCRVSPEALAAALKMLSSHSVPPPTPVEPDAVATGDTTTDHISSHDLMVALQAIMLHSSKGSDSSTPSSPSGSLQHNNDVTNNDVTNNDVTSN